jgi:MobA/MobL family
MAAVAHAAAYAGGHYHFSVEGVGRGNGAPVMAKAAYRSGECLFDERTGQFHDYTGGAGRVIDSFIMARANAPAWTQHAAREARQRAWNEAERAEPRKNGRIANEIIVGLPHELTDAQRKELLSAFVLRIVEKHGVFADVSIHTAHDDRNIHAHVLLSHRELGPDGFGEIANTRYENRKRKGEMVREKVAGIAATPSQIKGLREQWAADVNRAYESAGLDIRVDHRSFEDRGIEDVPTIHLGPKAAAMERAGHASDRGDTNRIIEFGNAERRRLEAEKQRQDAEIIDLQAKLAARQAQAAAKGRVDDIRPPIAGQENTHTHDSRKRRKMAAGENMDDDIIGKQREQRQAAEERQAAIYNDMVADRNRADRFIQDWQTAHERGERDKRHLQEAAWRREAEGDITDVRARALLAAGESRDFIQSVRREGAMITQEHADLQREIALEKDPDKKQLLELKRDIQQADYMALANERIAAMSNLNGEQYKDARQQQETWAAIGNDLRKERLELQERMADQDMDKINQAVEQMNAADRQRAEFRADIRGMERGPQPDYAAAKGQRDDIRPATERAAGIQPAAQAFDPTAYPGEPALRVVARMWEAENKERAAPETPREAVQEHYAGAAPSAQARSFAGPGAPQPGRTDELTATRAGEAERPAAVIYSEPTAPARAAETPSRDLSHQVRENSQSRDAEAPAARETTDARQRQTQEPESTRENTDARQSSSAENAEITDTKAAKRAALARTRTETETSIAQAQERGHGYSR